MDYHKQSNENCYHECHSQTFSSQEKRKFGYLGMSSVSPFAGVTQSKEINLLYGSNFLKLDHPSDNLLFNQRYNESVVYNHYSNSESALSFQNCKSNNKLGVVPHLHESSSNSQYLKASSDSVPYFENKEHCFDLSKDLEQEDVFFLVTWLKNIEKQKKEKQIYKCKHHSMNLKISTIQNAFVESNQILMELELIFSKLTSITCSDVEYIPLVQKADKLKVKLGLIKSIISDATCIGKLKEVINVRRNKRQRTKMKKKQRKEKYLCQKKCWNEKGEKIDVWLKKMHDNQKTILQAQELKKSADSILHEVRTKQEETQEIKNLVIALQELREIRLKKGEIHGFSANADDRQIFENMSAELMVLIENQLQQYGLEEQTLRVMMENSPSVLPDKTHLPYKSTRSKEELTKKIYELFFGRNIPYDELNEQQKNFLASEESVDILINRRSSWDKYLAEDESPASISTAVPLGWVVPPSTSSTLWKKYH